MLCVDLLQHTVTGMHTLSRVEMGEENTAVDSFLSCQEQALLVQGRNVLLLAKYLCKIKKARADTNDH